MHSNLNPLPNPLLPTHNGEACQLCSGTSVPSFSMAFQPIVNAANNSLFAYEALTRGPGGESAHSVLSQSLHNNRYAMDQSCRERAIQLSGSLGLVATTADLCINFFPNAVYEPRQCLSRTMQAAEAIGLPLSRIIFEITETEEVRNLDHLRNIMQEYRKHGLRIAIDDFGAGYSGLALLASFQPDLLKIDQALIRLIDQRKASRTIVSAIVHICRDLGVQIIAEGIEREQEMQVLCDLGIHLMQGFWFAKPAFEALPVWLGPARTSHT